MKAKNYFKKVYQQLNKQQRAAVDQIDGPVMVLAGPGTGKTQVLSARIANILKQTDTDPRSILALTFTKSAAKNMRERLAQMIGKAAYYVQINTFHAFCKEVIDSHPEYFPLERASKPLTSLESYDFLQKIIDELDLHALKPLNKPYFYLKDIVKSIANLKREGVSVKDFKKIIKSEAEALESLRDQLEEETKLPKKQKKLLQNKKITKTELKRKEKILAKNQELILIYEKYQENLRDSLKFDYEDMIALVLSAFEQNELLLREYQENILYFLVDEYQDSNSAQNRVLDLLTSYWGEDANIFVVGDPNQSIYRFQGASVENVLAFTKHYPQAEIITLDKGYRCSQTLYDAASKLIAENSLSLDETAFKDFNLALKSPHGTGKKIKVHEAAVQTLEIVYIAEEIKKLKKQAVNLAEIAVLYRNNSDADLLCQILSKWEIAYEIDGGGNILTDPLINQLLTLLQVLLDLRTATEDERFFELMQYPFFNLDHLSVMKLTRLANQFKKNSIVDLLKLGFEPIAEAAKEYQFPEEDFQKLVDFLAKLELWTSQEPQMTFPQWFEYLLKESNFLDWVLKHEQRLEILTNLNSLYREIKSQANANHAFNLASFLTAIDTMREHKLQIPAEDLNLRQDAVHLSTVHKAKGQEWDYVFLMHLIDGKWGNARKRDLIPLPDGILKNTDLSKKERNEDERRLFYVALTRAKKQVSISYSATFLTENYSRDVAASLFLHELEKVEVDEAKQINQNAEQYLEKIISAPKVRKIKSTEKQFFAQLLKNFKLSVTNLNTYLRDKQEFLENVLLKVPRAKPVAMAFGTAVHFALEQMYKPCLQKRQKLPLPEVLLHFKLALEKELLDENEFKKRLKYGEEILTQYYQFYQADQPKILMMEQFFGSGFHKTVLDDIALTGRVDRVDLLDRNKKTVRVIDYKTGAAKTVGFIEGRTLSAGLSEREQTLPKSIRGSYKRQLLFYKLLAQLDKSFNYQVEEGVFDFVEPSKQSGKLVQRKFSLPQDDVEDLKNLIREVMVEIRELKFLD
ncbi:MAG: ATP-dependent DNA helicase [Candidatus Woesebacteria bacterium]|jgi:DNA helicase-2/ATP-dependent DNA helicase PcrA